MASSFPFLAIARSSGLDYGLVLHYADYVRMVQFGTGPSAMNRLSPQDFHDIGLDNAYAIMAAVQHQEAIRRGELAPW